jgi:PAS domain S-box-containing protein
LTELAETISLYDAGRRDEARALVLSNTGLMTMNQIRTEIGTLEQEENSRQAIRLAEFRHSLHITVACIYVASSLAGVGAIVLAFYVLREMELREKHAREMHERQEWFRITLSSLGDGVIATDEKAHVIFLNPVAEQLTGWSLVQARGKRIDEVFPIFHEYTLKPVDNPVNQVKELGIVVGLANHTVLRHADGSLRPIEDSAAPIRDDRDSLVGVVLVFRDATRERESQEILRKTEKLAAAARLAATFAHEINNPLEAVVNLVYIVKEIQGLPDAAIQPLELAEHELERVSHIARQTLGFYRESKVPGQVGLPAIIENVLKLYTNKLKTRNIQVACEFSACPPVQGLAGELTQAISNLISNAADAIGQHGIIHVGLSSLEEAESVWAKLVIEDDGPGIAPEQRSRIFEPFFTTKIDVGTGLGLWVTREIIQRHGGSIDAGSKTGIGEHGAVFTILLPCAPPN